MRLGMIALFMGGLSAQVIELNPTSLSEEEPEPTARGSNVLVSNRAGVVPNSLAIMSQAFTDSMPPFILGYDNSGADDFFIPACESWEVETFLFDGNYFNFAVPNGGEGPAESFNIYILNNAGGQPNTSNLNAALYIYENLSYQEIGSADFQITLPSPAYLSGGAAGTTYWLVIQANQSIFSAGQWGWTVSTTSNGSNTAMWKQDFAGILTTSSCVDAWGTIIDCGVQAPGGSTNFSFELRGEIQTKMVTVNPTNLNLIEGGNVGSFEVVLNAIPCGTVTIDLVNPDGTEIALDASSLVFSEVNWDVPQTVTVTPQLDGVNDGDIMLTITTTASSVGDAGFNGAPVNDVDVVVANIDAQPVLIVSPTSVQITEGGGGMIVNITHGADVTPSNDVSIDLTIGPDLQVVHSTVVLTAANSYSANFTVSALTDHFVEGTENLTIITQPAVSMDGNFSGLNPTDLQVQVLDINVAQVFVSGGPLTINEVDAPGGSQTLTYTLSGIPSSPVTFIPLSGDTTEASVSPNLVTLDNTNWNTGFNVQVAPIDEDYDDGDITFVMIGESTESVDPFWDNIDVQITMATVIDDDTAGAIVNPSMLTIPEGSSDQFTVVLSAAPLFPVNLLLISGDITEALIHDGIQGAAEQLSLSFNDTNWTTPQAVTVEAQIDNTKRKVNRADGPQTFTIITDSFSGGDAAFTALTDAQVEDVSLTVTDIDGPAGVVVSPSNLLLDEGGIPGQFSLVLTTSPTATVTIPIGTGDPTEVTVAPNSLNFDDTNWDTPQFVTVTPEFDGEIDGNQMFQIVNGPAHGGNYAGISVAPVNITVNDIDTCGPAIIQAPPGQSITVEGTPHCVFDLFDCTEESELFLGTFTLDANGFIDTGVIAGTATCYRVYDNATGQLIGQVVSIPTLSRVPLLTLLAGLFFLAIFVLKKTPE